MNTAPADASMLHPYHAGGAQDFNIWYFLIAIFSAVYNSMSWQGSSGFQSSAKSPHEARMGGIIGGWRGMPLACMIILLALSAFAVMHLPQYTDTRSVIQQVLAGISDPTIRTQMTVPVAIAHMLPVGIKGLLLTAMLFFSFTCHDTYMHSWGTIFVQDVILPMRKTPMTPQQHIRYLRYSIIFVAVFSFFFSLLFPQSSKILFFFAGTGTIWLGGAGAIIVGGLYWKWGTTAGAYTALIVGVIVGLASLTIPPIYQSLYHADFPINNQWLYFTAMGLALVSYVIISLLTLRKEAPFNLDHMLHRGLYAQTDLNKTGTSARESLWLKLLGINKDFTFTDKIWAGGLLVWNLAWFAAFFVVTAIHFLYGTSEAWWAKFWQFYILLYFIIGIPTTIWFAIGGLRDIRELFRTLDHLVRDPSDDGRVIHEPEKVPLPSAKAISQTKTEKTA
jgi:SSS family solute:Na+ symporter